MSHSARFVKTFDNKKLNLYEAAQYLGMRPRILSELAAFRRIPAERVRLADRRTVYRFDLADLHAAGYRWARHEY